VDKESNYNQSYGGRPSYGAAGQSIIEEEEQDF